MENSNKFGYYMSGNKYTYSKYEALENGPTTWHFNDELFSALNWKKEPSMLLWEMYKERCRQIRSQYDYCVIWYSGGSDSHNILQAWLESGCKIDEIATTWNYETTGEYNNHQNAEITNVVLPDMKKLKDAGYDFHFRLIDIPSIGLQAFPRLNNNLEYYFNYNFQLSSIGKQFLRDTISEYKNLISSGKKVVFIWGKDKPNLSFENNKYSAYFIDTVDDCIGPYSQRQLGWFDELFYWTPDFPQLPIKMAHTVKNFLRASTKKEDFIDIKYKNYESGYSPTLNAHMKIESLKTLLYPKWSNNIFCNGKSPRRILGLRDEWFLKQNSYELNTAKAAIHNYLRITNQKNINSLFPLQSKKYLLE